MSYYDWSIVDIKKGFNKFYKKNKRLPTSYEIDNLHYLPSSKTMQRRFGGLIRVRKMLGYSETNLSNGKYRSEIMKKGRINGLNAEKWVKQLLVDKFGEPFVHEQKIYYFNNTVDFFIYCKPYSFGIEVVRPGNFRSLQSNINHKINKYKKFTYPFVFLVVGKQFSQTKIDRWIKNKTKKLPINSNIYNMRFFNKYLENFSAYQNIDLIKNNYKFKKRFYLE